MEAVSAALFSTLCLSEMGHVLSGTRRFVKARVRESNKSWSLLTLSPIDQL